MKITRKQLRQMIQEVNPGSQFKWPETTKDREDKTPSWGARRNRFMREQTQKTVDWFEEVVFPAIESNDWPITVTANYLFNFDLLDGDLLIKKGQTIKGIHDKLILVQTQPEGKPPLKTYTNPDNRSWLPRKMTLGQIYHQMEERVTENPEIGVLMQSDAGEAIKAAEKEKDDIQAKSVEITTEQLRQIINEEINLLEADANSDGKLSADELRDIADDLEGVSGPNFPSVSHPVIAPYFNEEKYHDKEGTGWAKEYKTYRYKHGGGTTGHQDLVIYYKTNGTYMARVYGAYNNRLSDDDKGEHPDAISAVEKALNTAPGGNRPPLAKDMISKVGEPHIGSTGGAWYD